MSHLKERYFHSIAFYDYKIKDLEEQLVSYKRKRIDLQDKINRFIPCDIHYNGGYIPPTWALDAGMCISCEFYGDDVDPALCVCKLTRVILNKDLG